MLNVQNSQIYIYKKTLLLLSNIFEFLIFDIQIPFNFLTSHVLYMYNYHLFKDFNYKLSTIHSLIQYCVILLISLFFLYFCICEFCTESTLQHAIHQRGTQYYGKILKEGLLFEIIFAIIIPDIKIQPLFRNGDSELNASIIIINKKVYIILIKSTYRDIQYLEPKYITMQNVDPF